MLVLGRRLGERIVIDGGRIVVEVVAVRPDGRVRLGITAPREVPIHREEVQNEIDRERAAVEGGEASITSDEREQCAEAEAELRARLAAAEQELVRVRADRDAGWSQVSRYREQRHAREQTPPPASDVTASAVQAEYQQATAPARPGLPPTWLPGDAI